MKRHPNGNSMDLNCLSDYDCFGRVFYEMLKRGVVLPILEVTDLLESLALLHAKALDKCTVRATIPPISGTLSRRRRPKSEQPGFMTSIPPSSPPEKKDMMDCKHPRVQIVSRDEDSEFVECLECGDIFDSSEFKDMNIEETKFKNQA